MSDKKEIKMNEDVEKELEDVSGGGVNWGKVGRDFNKVAKGAESLAGKGLDTTIKVAQTKIGSKTVGEHAVDIAIKRWTK